MGVNMPKTRITNEYICNKLYTALVENKMRRTRWYAFDMSNCQ